MGASQLLCQSTAILPFLPCFARFIKFQRDGASVWLSEGHTATAAQARMCWGTSAGNSMTAWLSPEGGGIQAWLGGPSAVHQC